MRTGATNRLLPEYIHEFGCEEWNAVYDARRHFAEPHTDKKVVPGSDMQSRSFRRAVEAE